MNERTTFEFAEATPVEEKKLEDTIELMTSDSYKDRFKAEYCQLDIRIRKLETMLIKLRNGGLNFKPSSPVPLLDEQLKVMKAYRAILHDRAVCEEVELTADKADVPEPSFCITREDAVNVLYDLANSNVLAEDITEQLAEIANIIDDENLGFHFWGADPTERAKLFTAVRADLITEEYKAKCRAISDKYGFVPSVFEDEDIRKYIDEYNSDGEDE